MITSKIPFQDLETRGFVVIDNFLEPELIQSIEQLHLDYVNKVTLNNNPNKNYLLYHNYCPPVVVERCRELVTTIAQTTLLTTNHVIDQVAYLDNQLINFPWHQDHENYWQTQTTRNSLNFWIAITKPNDQTDGLEVIDLDRLAEKVPEFFYRRVLDKGASTYFEQPTGITQVIDDDIDQRYEIPVNFNAIKTSIAMRPGSLVILRGDLIHRSQPKVLGRLAISIRAVDDRGVISRKQFYSGGQTKRQMIAKSPAFGNIIKNFEGAANLTFAQARKSS